MPRKPVKRNGYWYATGTEAGHRIRKSTHISAVGRENKARAESMLSQFSEDIRKKAAQGHDAVVKAGFLVDHRLHREEPRHPVIMQRVSEITVAASDFMFPCHGSIEQASHLRLGSMKYFDCRQCPVVSRWPTGVLLLC
ncbi:hypothetical protein SAE02_63190 [Skermanella aerolata]|uniref:Uncharacterized protein n=1 Tax=Skermanella aerolata TaxID=393310 RepID=A0A512E0B9_9PROT|nr:hypothetical protein [Skermanella aerolata]KJB90492.1 hypothetical protein N826_39380 [Skermanella aerolata KACC 11604]GEO42171.1 hypothetical protein SAE02_63190 [Skermanella aerolata]